jgi:sugar fermentation stimulation protein A
VKQTFVAEHLAPQAGNTMSVIHQTPGTYMLLLTLPNQSEVEVGRTRRIRLEPGLYCYVGSALGLGGRGARLRRHAHPGERKHWHIDYLLPYARLLGALVIEDGIRHECMWATWVSRVAISCVDGFGASDCTCTGHLFHLGDSLDETLFVKKVEEDLQAQYVSRTEIVSLTV